MTTQDPFTAPETAQALAEVECEVAEFFRFLSAEEFVLRVGDAWTPAEHLLHLCTAVSAVARGFSINRWLLRLRFGRARSPSRRYLEVRDDYRERLSRGGRATGPYVPDREDSADERIEERRAAILARWGRVNSRLREAAERWSERELDRIRMPHPLLGMLSARELLFFTVYHNQHHVAAAKRRLPRFGPVER